MNNESVNKPTCGRCLFDIEDCVCPRASSTASGYEQEDQANKTSSAALGNQTNALITGAENEYVNDSLELTVGEHHPEVAPNVLAVISQLLTDKLLVIESDREAGVFSIQLSCEPKALTQEQSDALNTYASAVLQELAAFKVEHGITKDCAKVMTDDDGNVKSLQIMLSPVSLYDAFIERLASKQLLPMNVFKQHTNEIENRNDFSVIEYPENMNHFTGTPFQTEPTLGNSSKADDDENQSENSYSSPFDTPSCKPDGADI